MAIKITTSLDEELLTEVEAILKEGTGESIQQFIRRKLYQYRNEYKEYKRDEKAS